MGTLATAVEMERVVEMERATEPEMVQESDPEMAEEMVVALVIL